MGTERVRRQGRIATPAFCLLFVSSLAINSFYYLNMTLMARYALETFACSEVAAGFAASIFMVGGVLGRIVSGQVPGTGTRRWAVGSMLVMLVAAGAYFLTSAAYPLLLLVRVVHGLAFGIAGTLVPALAVEQLPAERMGEGTGYFMLSVTLGVAIGPMLALFSVGGFNWPLLFGIALGIVALGFAATLLAPSGNGRDAGGTREDEADARGRGRFSLRDVVDGASWKLTLFIGIMTISYTPINTFMSNYAEQLGIAYFAPFVFLVYAIVLLVSRPYAGKLQDRHGHNVVLVPSIACMVLCLVICAAAGNALMLALVGVFMALGFGTSMSVSQAAATKLAGPGNASRAIATLFLFADAGSALGPVLMGVVAAAAGFRAMYAACAVVALCSLVYYVLVGRRAGKAEG